MTGVDRSWRVPLAGRAPTDVPDEWARALAAVAVDLRCRRQGRAITFDGVQWELTVSAEWVSIGMATLTNDSDLGGFSIGRNYALETTPEQATVWVAEVVQEELAGYEFVQWPSDGWRLLAPELRDTEAVWVDPSTGGVVLGHRRAVRLTAGSESGDGVPSRYDLTGRSYSSTRRPDLRVGAVIDDALRGMVTVANIGAGTGSYEPAGTVVAVEPSRVMIAQRPPGSAPAVQAVAEHLPIGSNSVDAALAVLTVHHWRDVDRGVAELQRIARNRVVVLTWDHSVTRQFWLLREYLPAAAQTDADLAVPITKLTSLLGNPRIVPLPVPHDCADGFGGAYWRRPHAYLDPTVQSGMSLFALTPEPLLREGLSRLRADLSSGAWDRNHQDLLAMEELDLGYRLLIAEQQPPSAELRQ